MAIVTVGIDLAKNIFAVHGVNETGKPELVRSEVSRARLTELTAKLPPCLIDREVCSGARHWAHEFSGFGYTVRLVGPRFVVSYLHGRQAAPGLQLPKRMILISGHC